MKIGPTILLLTTLSCSTPNGNSKEESFVPQSGTKYTETINFDMDKGELTGKTVDLVVYYGAVACPCAQWFESTYENDSTDGREYFYLEPGRQGIINADTLFNGRNYPIQLALTGQFYSKVGYPQDYYPTKGNPQPARVFRYEEIKILRNGKQ